MSSLPIKISNLTFSYLVDLSLPSFWKVSNLKFYIIESYISISCIWKFSKKIGFYDNKIKIPTFVTDKIMIVMDSNNTIRFSMQK